jgi:hypothetical protein
MRQLGMTEFLYLSADQRAVEWFASGFHQNVFWLVHPGDRSCLDKKMTDTARS